MASKKVEVLPAVEVADAGRDMKLRIQAAAEELLVRRGVSGCTFAVIAEQLGITRANIHYHFGNKGDLIDQVIAQYLDLVTGRFRAIWEDETIDLATKFERTIQLNRDRYYHFNPRNEGEGWSLITRMRGEEDALSPSSVAVLRRYSKDVAAAVTVGLKHSIKVGELKADAPVEEICVQLVNIVSCAGLTTRDALNFDRLDEVYRAFLKMLLAAYGSDARTPAKGARTTTRPANAP